MTTGRINQVTTLSSTGRKSLGGVVKPIGTLECGQGTIHIASSKSPGHLPLFDSCQKRRHGRPWRGIPHVDHARRRISTSVCPRVVRESDGQRPVVHGPHPTPLPWAMVRWSVGSEESDFGLYGIRPRAFSAEMTVFRMQARYLLSRKVRPD